MKFIFDLEHDLSFLVKVLIVIRYKISFLGGLFEYTTFYSQIE